MIEGYPARPSVSPGETLRLHVSTDAPAFRLHLVRWGATAEAVGDFGLGTCAGEYALDGPLADDWGWPAVEIQVPADAQSGVYLGRLIEVADASDPTAGGTPDVDAVAADLLFVVLPGASERSSILYKLPTNTYHAYNGTGYGSLYGEAVWDNTSRPIEGFKVTMRRPGGGAGGVREPSSVPFPYDEQGIRNTFAYWDAPFVSWLESCGYRIDYCTDWDVDVAPEILEDCHVVLAVGHDEYWSERERTALDQFVERGGNLAVLGGDVEGYRVTYVDDGTAMVCRKAYGDSWEAADPAHRVCGVALLGGWWNGTERERLGFTVADGAHWVFEGTGLATGDEFGRDTTPPLVGYEVGGRDLQWRHGYPVAVDCDRSPINNGAVSPRLDTSILATAVLSDKWQGQDPGATVTMLTYTSRRGGTVFTASTTDWPIVACTDSTVGQITRNVIDRLSLKSLRVIGALPTTTGLPLAIAGAGAAFRVDDAASEEQLRWSVSAGDYSAVSRSTISVAVPEEVHPLTVTVTRLDEHGEPAAFGSRTVFPLTEAEYVQSEMSAQLRDIHAPREPFWPLGLTRLDPLTQQAEFFPGTLRYMTSRMADFERNADRLVELHAGEGLSVPELPGERRPRQERP